MRGREFIGVLLGVACACSAMAQIRKTWRIGVVTGEQ